MFNAIRDAVGQEITWVPTATFKDRYDLTAGNLVFATLDMSSWGSGAKAGAAEGELTIHTRGLSQRTIEITTPNDQTLIASYRSNWTGNSGRLQFADGRTFTWRGLNLWGTRKGWLDAAGQPLLIFQSNGWTRRLNVTPLPQAAEIPELSLFAILGLYLVIRGRRAAAAATVAATT